MLIVSLTRTFVKNDSTSRDAIIQLLISSPWMMVRNSFGSLTAYLFGMYSDMMVLILFAMLYVGVLTCEMIGLKSVLGEFLYILKFPWKNI